MPLTTRPVVVDWQSLRATQQRLRTLLAGNHGTLRGFVRLALAQLELILGRLDDHLHPDAQQTKRLVFVCLGNINRSAFAEGVARAQGAAVCSIGLSTTTGAPAFATAIRTARAFDIDLSAHVATNLADYQFAEGDLLLAMEIRHVKRLLDHGIPPRAIALLGNWSTPQRIHLHDPHTLSDAYYHTCFTLIHSAVSHLVRDLRAGQSPCVSQ